MTGPAQPPSPAEKPPQVVPPGAWFGDPDGEADAIELVFGGPGRARGEAELRFRALADANPALIWVDGPDARQVFVSRAWSEFVDTAVPGAMLRVNWRELIHPDDRARYTEVRAAAEADAVPFELEYRLRGADGRYRWVLDRGAPAGSTDDPGGYVGGCLDVDTQHQERERQRLLAVVTGAVSRDLGLVDRRTALARVLVEENLVEMARVIDFDSGLPPAIAARSEENERLITQLDSTHVHTRGVLSRFEPLRVTVDEDYIVRSSPDERQQDLRRRLNMGVLVQVPLMARGRVAGVLSGARSADAPEQLDEADFALLVEIAERASVALDNALLLEREQLTSHRLELLQGATAALSAAATPAQVAETAVAEFARLLDTPAVAVFEMREHSTLDALTMGGWGEPVTRDWLSFPIDAQAPPATAVRRREPIWLADEDDWRRDYPDLRAPVVEGYGYLGIGGLPLLAGGDCVGVVVVGFRDIRRLGPQERAAAAALADQCAQALQRAGLLAAESEARRAAEDLGKLVGALSGATTPQDVGEIILSYAADLGAVGTVVALRDGRRLTTLLASAPDIGAELDLDAAHPLAFTARCGRPVWLASRSPLAWSGGGFPTDGRLPPTQMSIPLVVGGSVIGAIGLRYADEVPAFSAAGRATVLAVAGQCAQALERARLYQAEHEVAEVLQRSLLPRRLPDLERLAVAANYLPAATGAQAGGDWYDLLPIGDSRIAIAVGDVVGHGAPAAAVMGQLRSALAGYLLEGHSPATALEHLNRFATLVDGALGSTCACLTVDWDTGELRFARAGHPPILLLESEGTRFLEVGGTVLGTWYHRAPYQEATTSVAPGATVVLYTDGLVERRDELLSDGLPRLARAAADLVHLEPKEMVPALVKRMLLDAAPSDDIAVVAVRLLPETAIRAPAAPVGSRPTRPGAYLAPTGSASAAPRTYRLDGDLTMDTVDGARVTLLELLGVPGDLVIDLSEVGYVGSAGVALLAEVTGTARDRGVQLSVRVSADSFADHAIALTGLAGALNIEFDSLR